jgi:hypothetical protein
MGNVDGNPITGAPPEAEAEPAVPPDQVGPAPAVPPAAVAPAMPPVAAEFLVVLLQLALPSTLIKNKGPK